MAKAKAITKASGAARAARVRAAAEAKAIKARSNAARAKARASQNMTRQALGAVVAGGAIGLASRSGYLERVPRIAGMPTTLTVAAVGLVGGEYAPGKLGDALRIVGIGAGVVAAYQLATGQTIAGDASDEARIRAEMAQMARKLESSSADVAGGFVEHENPIPVGHVTM